MLFFDLERKSLYDAITKALEQMLRVVNPMLQMKGDEDEEVQRENVAFENDIIRSEREGRYAGSEQRLQMYLDHMKRLQSGDPDVRVVGDTRAAQEDIEGT